MKDERVTAVIENLSSLIVAHGGMLASEQYCPKIDADESDEFIKERQKWVRELRDIRRRFEDLVTGIVD